MATRETKSKNPLGAHNAIDEKNCITRFQPLDGSRCPDLVRQSRPQQCRTGHNRHRRTAALIKKKEGLIRKTCPVCISVNQPKQDHHQKKVAYLADPSSCTPLLYQQSLVLHSTIAISRHILFIVSISPHLYPTHIHICLVLHNFPPHLCRHVFYLLITLCCSVKDTLAFIYRLILSHFLNYAPHATSSL